MTAKDMAGLPVSERLTAMEERTPMPRELPSSTPKGGNRNLSRSSSSRTGSEPEPFFKPLATFLAEARSLPEPAFLIPRLVPDSGRVLVVAEPNAGKTFLALVIAKAAAQSGRATLIVLEEGGKRRTGERFDNLKFEDEWPVSIAHLRGAKLAHEPTLATIIEAVRGATAPVVVLDPLVSVFEGDENKTPDMAKFRDQLERIMAANERTLLILIHHASKAGGRGEGSAAYSARGSSVTTGWADAQLNLTYVEPSAPGQVAFDVLVAKMRDGEKGARERFTIDLGTGVISSTEVTGSDAEERKSQAIEFAREPITKTALAKKLKMAKQTGLRLVDTLLQSGDLEWRDGSVVARNREVTP